MIGVVQKTAFDLFRTDLVCEKSSVLKTSHIILDSMKNQRWRRNTRQVMLDRLYKTASFSYGDSRKFRVTIFLRHIVGAASINHCDEIASSLILDAIRRGLLIRKEIPKRRINHERQQQTPIELRH